MNWTLGPCYRRSIQLERMESPGITDQELSTLFDFWEFCGRRLGVYGPILRFLSASVGRGTPPPIVSILILRSGRGALPVAVADWFRRQRIDCRILAAERYGRVTHMAREKHSAYKEIVFDTRDWQDPQFLQAAQFDYVISSGSLHHEASSPATKILKAVNRLAKRGFMIEDSVRDLRAYLAFSNLARLYGEAVRQDAETAIQRSFTLSEVRELAKDAGVEYADLTGYFGCRFTLSAERGLDVVRELSPVPGLAGA